MMERIEANNGRRKNSPDNNKTMKRAELESHNQSVRVNEQTHKTVTTDRLEKIIVAKRLQASVVWYTETNVSETSATSTFRVECRQRRQVPPKRQYLSTKLHDVTQPRQ
jgi:hypothetical protein